MADDLPGKDVSLWVDTTDQTNYPSLPKDLTCDVAIVGGGITGLMSAWFLQAEGLNTVLVEKRRLAEWTTGYTTAKLTSQHYLVYKYLVDEQGEDVARAYADANQNGIDAVEKLANELGIECDFSRRDAYVYANNQQAEADIRAEVEITQKIGLPSSFETTTDLPFKVRAAIKFSNQAQFHPRKFLLAIAANLNNKVQIFEQTEATGIKPGTPNVLETKQGKIKATYIIEASQFPFWQPKLFEKAMWTKMSYALGVRLKPGTSYPQGMYITTDDPMRTIRSHPYEDGEILIFGGESHEEEEDNQGNRHFKNLITDVQQKFEVEEVLYRWLAGDAMPHDRMPYIGEYPDTPTVFTATGFKAWGLAWAMSATQIIRDKILGRPVDWAEPFSLKRLTK